ncbi:HNH endonuclease signature motif containing protein [Sphingomonas soli]|uniref:HNH endonuclease signature motif containing protein n=1 Tax=Sphingomonas soli TaxID=266127 RepID=UPI000A0646F8
MADTELPLSPRMAQSLVTLPHRYWPRVDRSEGCWLWTGAKGTRGYGHIRVLGRMRKATHVAWFFETGGWPEAGKMLCHRCDNPSCVNPSHLFIGTDADNAADRQAKGRTVLTPCPIERRARGERNGGGVKLNADKVRAIRGSAETYAVCGERFGISAVHVGRIKRGEKWAHIQ